MVIYTDSEEDKRATVDGEPSNYLKYLPALFSEDEFLGRFLKIFESVIDPIEKLISQVYFYFDPKMAPEELLPWLASWVDLVLDEGWPLEKRRQLISSVVDLYRLRGTRQGLSEYLRIYTGVKPVIVEHFGGMALGERSQLGWNTVLGEREGHFITAILELEDPSAVDQQKVRAIIEAEKPAHVAYALNNVVKESKQESDAP